MTKPKVSPIQSKILAALIKDGGYMNTAEVAEDAGISWNTALNHLNVLEGKEWVESSGDTTKYWRAIT